LITSLTNTEKPALLRRLFCVLIVATALLASCSPAGDGDRTGANDTAPSANKLDSILPIEEAVRRFREGLPEVTRFDGGAHSRDALVRDFVRAVELNDTSAVQRMVVSRAEYAYLYFPSSIYMNKPYQQAPALAWFLNMQNSEKGVSRVMRRLGGQDLAFENYSCADASSEGTNTFWRSCTLVYRDPEEKTQVTRRLFGAIMERDGRFKFLSFANDF